MGTGTEKKGYLGDFYSDKAAFMDKWRLSGEDAKLLSDVSGTDFESLEDVDRMVDDLGVSEDARKKLHQAYEAELSKGLPPAPPPPPDFTDEVLLKARMQEKSKTATRQGLASTFLTGKSKVGQ